MLSGNDLVSNSRLINPNLQVGDISRRQRALALNNQFIIQELAGFYEKVRAKALCAQRVVPTLKGGVTNAELIERVNAPEIS